MMGSIRGFSWNCGGLRRSAASTLSKIMYFEKTFKNSFDFFFFLETHHKDENDIPNELMRYKDTHHLVHSEVAKNETHAGIIGLIRKKYDEPKTEEIMQGRILNFKLSQPGEKMTYCISVVYLPTNKNLNGNIMRDIVHKLRLPNQNDAVNYVIMGDFNFIDHEKDKRNGLNPKDRQINQIWIPFLNEMDMVDPFREQNPKRRVWSFVGTGVAKSSRIDRIYVNSINANDITEMKYIQTPFQGHKILAFNIRSDIEWGRGYYKLNTSIFEDEEYEKLVDETVSEVQILNNRSPSEKWEAFLLSMKSKSIKYSTKRNAVKRKLKNELIRQITRIEESQETESMEEHYAYLKGRLKEVEDKEIEGYIRRTKFLAPYEKNEYDIAFYSKLEGQKRANDRISQIAEKKDGDIYTDQQNIIRISTDFYRKLYQSERVNEKIQDKLLRNVKTKLSKEKQTDLDKPITDKEIEKAIQYLQKGKSPGLDGFPVEFYKKYWFNIKKIFVPFVNEVKEKGLSSRKNVSVIKLAYKKTGEIYLLTNYRPISLINADVKIITKVLAERLKYVLPSIIHCTQTAVYGRKIDQNIHLIRDLIELSNREDDTTAFLFLDQEKAFDRVNHKFLFKTMKAFGIGESFIGWVRTIYSNASSTLNINGYFSETIALQRGVRQGCPLSALLYVLVIEVLAIQLRLNPNIVGFTVGGEKIISVHYMDDTTIIIKQNRCFKEVIKELELYEEASEARVNYKKTKGLWTGSWKGRRTSPIEGIKWTSGDVRNLGIYFGNENPDFKTFQEIVPEFKKRLGYWHRFTLSKMGKSRTVQMFLASKLVYAIKFYPIPLKFRNEIQESIFKYINFPNRVITIGQKEMWKIKKNGGCKLVNIQVKSETSKAKWLMEIATNPDLKIHLETFSLIVGAQKGENRGKDIIFMDRSFLTRSLQVSDTFYKEALQALSMFRRRKGIAQPRDWDGENIFYNPLILSTSGKTIKETEHFRKNKIYKLGQLLEEKSKEERKLPFDRKSVTLLRNIKLDLGTPEYGAIKEHMIFLGNTEVKKMSQITQKDLYEDAILFRSRDHTYQGKWVEKLSTVLIVWEEVWDSVHNLLSLNETRTAIWEQIHLNFYTQYSYNKWHSASDPCPLCGEKPKSIFHIILHCNLVNTIWDQLLPVLSKLSSKALDDAEKAFGIVQIKKTPGIILRNWLGYKLREEILLFERSAYHQPKKPSMETFKAKFNQSVARDVKLLMYRFSNEGKLSKFDELVALKGVVCKKQSSGEYCLRTVFK